jgi:hypothetical protein
MKRLLHVVQIVLFIAAGVHLAVAQDRTLTVQIKDAQDHPLSGIRISTENGGATSKASDVSGKTMLLIKAATGAVKLTLVDDMNNRNLVFMQPWDGRITVPPFKDDSENFVLVVLIPMDMKLYIMSGGGPRSSLVASLSHRTAQPVQKKDAK